MLDIPPATFRRAHNAVANSTLWFVHHMLYDTPNLPRFGSEFEREWESYRAYNRAFAEALADEAGPRSPDRGPVRAVVQDYHLSLVPRMLADLRPDIRIAHFSHTPWAPPDYYRMLPDDVGREVLEGVLGADHAGFLASGGPMRSSTAAKRSSGRRARTWTGPEGSHLRPLHQHRRAPAGRGRCGLISRASEPDVRARLATLAETAAAGS